MWFGVGVFPAPLQMGAQSGRSTAPGPHWTGRTLSLRRESAQLRKTFSTAGTRWERRDQSGSCAQPSGPATFKNSSVVRPNESRRRDQQCCCSISGSLAAAVSVESPEILAAEPFSDARGSGSGVQILGLLLSALWKIGKNALFVFFWLVLEGIALIVVTLVGLAALVGQALRPNTLFSGFIQGVTLAHSEGLTVLLRISDLTAQVGREVESRVRFSSYERHPSVLRHHHAARMASRSKPSKHQRIPSKPVTSQSPGEPSSSLSIVTSPVTGGFQSSQTVEGDPSPLAVPSPLPLESTPGSGVTPAESESSQESSPFISLPEEPLLEKRKPTMTDLAAALRLRFPAPTEYDLPGRFDGKNISDYLERFEEACEDYEVAGKDRVQKFEKWCDYTHRKIIGSWASDKKSSWEEFTKAAKKHWKPLDPEQVSNHMEKLQKIVERQCDWSAESIYAAFERVEYLLARVRKKDLELARRTAVTRMYENFSGEVQAGFRSLNKTETEIKEMDFDQFRAFIIECLRGGVNAGSRHLKIRPYKHSPLEAAGKVRPPTPPLPSSSTAKKEPGSPETVPVTGQFDASSKEIDDLTEAFREMKIKQQRAQEAFQNRVEQLRVGGLRTNTLSVEEQEELHSLLFQTRGGEKGKQVNWKTGDRATAAKVAAVTSSASLLADHHHVAENPGISIRCYYCGTLGHTQMECPTKISDEYHGICHMERGFWVLGRSLVKRGPDTFVQIEKSDVADATQIGRVGDLIRAYASQFPTLDSWGPFKQWCDEWKDRHGRAYIPDLTLVKDHSFLRLPQPQHKTGPSVRVAMQRVAVAGVDVEHSVFDYLKAENLNHWVHQKDGGRMFVQQVTARRPPTPEVDIAYSAPLGLRGAPRVEEMEDSGEETDKDVIEVGVNNQEVPAKRVRVEDEGDTEIRGKSATEAPRVILTPAYRQSQSDQSGTTKPAPAGKKTAATEKPVGGTSDVATTIQNLVLRSLNARAPLTVEDLIDVSPAYREALIAYIQQRQSGYQVVEYHGSSDPTKDGSPQSSRGATGQTVQTNVNYVVETVPAFFGVTPDGEYGLVKGGFWERLALGTNSQPVTPQAETLLQQPITKLTLTERAEIGVITRVHALPLLYCHFETVHSDKELALLDSGSECNAISQRLATKYQLAIQSTNVVSKGLYESKRFLGETQGRIILAGKALVGHFFVMEDEPGGYDILLGMPFFRDTSLTFDFAGGRLITANILCGETIIKAHVVSKETYRKRLPPN